jgi:hypothetical protein
MASDPQILEYATPKPVGDTDIVRFAMRVGYALGSGMRLIWRARPQLAALTAMAIATWSVALAWKARTTLFLPVFGGCGMDRQAARNELLISAMSLVLFVPLWFIARRNERAVSFTRMSFAVTAVWWVFIVVHWTHRFALPWNL